MVIPATLDNLPVTRIGEFAFSSNNSITKVRISRGPALIGNRAFAGCANLSLVSIAKTVTSVGAQAFGSCTNLTEIYFEGVPPSLDSDPFENSTQTTVFYSPAMPGWSSTFGTRPAIAWNATISGGGFASDGRFTFRVNGNSGVTFVVEKADSSASTNWTSVLTFRLNGGPILVKDLQSGITPRFYRLRSP